MDPSEANTHRGRLDQPGEHELEERLVRHGVKAQQPVGRTDGIDQELRGLGVDHRDRGIRARGEAQVELFLPGVELVPADLHQRSQLRIRVS